MNIFFLKIDWYWFFVCFLGLNIKKKLRKKNGLSNFYWLMIWMKRLKINLKERKIWFLIENVLFFWVMSEIESL